MPKLEAARQIALEHCSAWTKRLPKAVAERYADQTAMSINHGEAMTSRSEISEMAAGFMADFPDLVLSLDSVLVAGHHMVYAWTFEGHHKETGNYVRFTGWEEWGLDENIKVTKSLGWYDANDYERQVAGQ